MEKGLFKFLQQDARLAAAVNLTRGKETLRPRRGDELPPVSVTDRITELSTNLVPMKEVQVVAGADGEAVGWILEFGRPREGNMTEQVRARFLPGGKGALAEQSIAVYNEQEECVELTAVDIAGNAKSHFRFDSGYPDRYSTELGFFRGDVRHPFFKETIDTTGKAVAEVINHWEDRDGTVILRDTTERTRHDFAPDSGKTGYEMGWQTTEGGAGGKVIAEGTDTYNDKDDRILRIYKKTEMQGEDVIEMTGQKTVEYGENGGVKKSTARETKMSPGHPETGGVPVEKTWETVMEVTDEGIKTTFSNATRTGDQTKSAVTVWLNNQPVSSERFINGQKVTS